MHHGRVAYTFVSSSTYKAATFENICCITHITGWLAAHLEVAVFSVPPTATLLLGHYTKVFSVKLRDVASFGSNTNKQSAKVFLPRKFLLYGINTGPMTQRTQGPSCVAHSFYDRLQATCVSVLNLNLWLCRCESYSPHCCTLKRHSSHQIVLFLLASFILSSLCKTQELSPLLCARLLVWLAICTEVPGSKVTCMKLSLCVCKAGFAKLTVDHSEDQIYQRVV